VKDSTFWTYSHYVDHVMPGDVTPAITTKSGTTPGVLLVNWLNRGIAAILRLFEKRCTETFRRRWTVTFGSHVNGRHSALEELSASYVER
jgi:hypothetical protein